MQTSLSDSLWDYKVNYSPLGLTNPSRFIISSKEKLGRYWLEKVLALPVEKAMGWKNEDQYMPVRETAFESCVFLHDHVRIASP